MLFTKFLEVCKNSPDSLALNSYTYKALLDIVESTEYSPICDSLDEQVLISILVAAKNNKPLIILPKNRIKEATIPVGLPSEFGLYLFSSGSTGDRKALWLPESMLLANADAAIRAQSITQDDSILTVCSLNHTGGINAQTLPGLLVGASITYKQFNPFTFFRDTVGHSVTHLVPVMIDSLLQVKNRIPGESLRLVVAGSDCVQRHHVELWQQCEIDFMVNYGLTEAGPIVCNHVFTPESNLEVFEQGIPLGTKLWCNHRIINGELHLSGSIVNCDGWLNTGDCVELFRDWIMYRGRTSAGCKIIPKQY